MSEGEVDETSCRVPAGVWTKLNKWMRGYLQNISSARRQLTDTNISDHEQKLHVISVEFQHSWQQTDLLAVEIGSRPP
jgi:hypothetical protein